MTATLPPSPATTREATGTTDAAPPRRRAVTAWVAIALGLLVIGGIGGAVSAANQWAQRGALDPDSTGPAGARALAEVLRDHGVEVEVARDRAAASAALGRGPATLVLPDAPALSDDAVAALADAASDVVLIEPRARTLDLLLPGASPAGVAADDAVPPDCDVADADRAGAIAPGGLYEPGDATGCYPAGEGFGLLVADTPGGRVAAVDARALFTNDVLAENGNAALAANLMGRHPLVVWYVPSVGDTDLADSDPSLGELTPPWVSPVIVLLLVTGVAAGVWRGRRFGPLVAERLPVTVRASETTEGRARLYARARDPLHAADRLRIGTLRRLAALLGLGGNAAAPDIADAAAGRAGLDRRLVRGILIDDIPRTDADLVALSARLTDLEAAVHAAVRPEGSPR
ncbi:DUF4350 domain-containing protein [Microbacterium sp. M3]|uniref:DUF4350 domain-containing protein n=1 Tax=Microbacterium arthrosphaerae TaxID=792652 RepID=A0ABU4H1Y2_9MICO|nr:MULTISPECIES: DUF4350 domain-containing protein [Microbacterium]MDW4573341.1 DUF4350 domain-containing protein [Microbacterium arthrosphaerae]MDW7607196.1 DUF4350 domain-containing protein [Microbacterium sp. M3]